MGIRRLPALRAGVDGGVLIGAAFGAAEAARLMGGRNIVDSPGRALAFTCLSAVLYALAGAAVGGAFGAIGSLLYGRGARDRTSPSKRRALDARILGVGAGTMLGILVFMLGAWWVRLAPPDLAVFRRYCSKDTLLVVLVSVVAGRVAFHAALRVARSQWLTRSLTHSVWRKGMPLALAAGALTLAGLFWHTGSGQPNSPGGGDRLNVVLITIDTLRADHLEFLGYDRPTSPVTKELAARSVVFRQAIAQYPLTTPSHASILTSRYVRSHGATGNAVPIHEAAKLLSEVLKEHGYTTAAFVTSPLVGTKYGFDRGFDYFVDKNGGTFFKASLADWVGQLRLPRIYWRLRGSDRATASVLRWLDHGPGKPFFLWVHQIAPHAPYAPPFAYERKWDTHRSRVVPTMRQLRPISDGSLRLVGDDFQHIVSLYDAEIAFTEALLAKLLDGLERNGLLESTLLVFTADHGECLYDRGNYFGHGRYLYQEEVRVPLLFCCPGRLPAGKVVEETVETIHIAPTILDLLGLPPATSFQGGSLMSLIRDEDAPTGGERPMHPIEDRPAFSINAHGKMVLYRGWKLIVLEDEAGRMELYDLAADPGETVNLADREPEKAQELLGILRDWDASVPVVRSGDYELGAEALRHLRALGYIN